MPNTSHTTPATTSAHQVTRIPSLPVTCVPVMPSLRDAAGGSVTNGEPVGTHLHRP